MSIALFREVSLKTDIGQMVHFGASVGTDIFLPMIRGFVLFLYYFLYFYFYVCNSLNCKIGRSNKKHHHFLLKDFC